VARLVGGIYEALGFLSQGHLVEVDRSGLVAGCLGQTATKTADVVASATGGVLFIDELGEDGSVSPAAASQVALASAEPDAPAATRTTEVRREHPHAYDDLRPSSGPKRRAPAPREARKDTRGLARHPRRHRAR
jgi:hypothetical protein